MTSTTPDLGLQSPN